ncbi:MAG: InlB B-repeat-containing protein [Clostridia bacterium]|nr:InlB B-repeat-containing protein [Clostridia bacterium]
MLRKTRKTVSLLLAVMMAVSLFTMTPFTANAVSVTGFLDTSSGSATGYFTYENHFYKIEWSSIDGSQTVSLMLDISTTDGYLRAYRNNSTSSATYLYSTTSNTNHWAKTDFTNLTPGQSTHGYTSNRFIAAGSSSTNMTKVCTVTCVAANAPSWNWAGDYSACTATFTCSADSSLTATVDAQITTSGFNKTASVTFNNAPYSDTVYAGVTVTWVDGDGMTVKTDTVLYGETPSYSGTTPTKTATAQYSYTFTGWSPAIVPATADATYTAQFSETVNKYTITWANYDGTVLETDTDVEYGEMPVYDGAEPTRSAFGYFYRFFGWTPSVSAVTGDQTYTAYYAELPQRFRVTLYPVGGQINAGNVDNYAYGEGAVLPTDVTKEHYSFGGWYTNAQYQGDPVAEITTTDYGAKEFYAKWIPDGYRITYDLDGGTVAPANPPYYTYETETFVLNNPTRPGYTFLGWYGTGLYGTSDYVEIAQGSTGDRSYYAVWKANSYCIMFDKNSENATGTMDPQIFHYDENAKLLSAFAFTAQTGYHFIGWATAPDGAVAYTDEQPVRNLTTNDGETIILYAIYAPNTYTVHFEINNENADGTMADQNFVYDDAAKALTANAFHSTVDEFLGWATAPNGTVVYEDEEAVRNLTAVNGGTVTLYAKWRIQYRIWFDIDVFSCYIDANQGQGRVYRAFAGDTVRISVNNVTYEYTISVVDENNNSIAYNASTYTFVMPEKDVWINATAAKRMAYTDVLLDDFDSWEDVSYLYDAENPTVTPTVTVKDGETTLEEGVHYTLEITNNTGSPNEMVTATVTVTGIDANGYTGTATREFRISPRNIANCTIGGRLEAYDDGYGVYYPLCENVEVYFGDELLEIDSDYEVEIDYDDTFVVGQKYQATIVGRGDWSGSQTFEFTVIELAHTIVYDANGGSGEMEGDTVSNSNPHNYYLPYCDFNPPYGYKFAYWEVSCEPGAKDPGDYFSVPYIWSESDVQTIVITANWVEKDQYPVVLPEHMVAVSGVNPMGNAYKDDVITFRAADGYVASNVKANGVDLAATDGIYSFTVTEPVSVTADLVYACGVGAHSLTLNGSIGVNFYAYLLNATDAAYAVFTVDGKTVEVPIDLTKYEPYGDAVLYKFTCNVAAAQIDTRITGKIVNGDIESEEFTYSVQTYLTEAQQTMANDAAFMALAGALATYGYYANELFAANPAFAQHVLFDDGGFANVTAASLASYQAQIISEPDSLTYVGSSLVLQSETAIRHYFIATGSHAVSYFRFSLKNADNTWTDLTPVESGEYYYVEIPNISSADLGRTYTVRVLPKGIPPQDEGSIYNEWNYSAMSYVYKALTQYENGNARISDALAAAVKALTLYYQAADVYFAQQNG